MAGQGTAVAAALSSAGAGRPVEAPASTGNLSPSGAASTAGRYAEWADAERRLHPEVVEALVDAGFARHFVPGRWGGADGTAADLLTAVALVGSSCTSAAWCGSLAAGAARMGAFLPEQGQAELWADGPDALIAGALIPSGRTEQVDGGWRLTGQWQFTSGIDVADWALVAGLVRGRPHFFAVPRASFTAVQDTWASVGMRGTGSNTLVLAEVFVPGHRVFDREEMLRGHAVGSSAPCHTAPLRAISGILFGAPALGAARGALHAWTVRMVERTGPDGTGPRTQAGPQLTLARVTGETDMAASALHRVATVCDRGAVDTAETASNPYQAALAVDILVGAVARLFRTAGSRGQLATSPLQRFWRDIHCLASHPALQLEPAGTAYGSQLFGAVPAPTS